MFFEDARDLTIPALALLESQKDVLGCPNLKIWNLVDFCEFAQKTENRLTRREKETIVDQAIFLIDQFYAHLPFKRARYASDPVQSLRLIRAQLDQFSDLAFHEQMLKTMVDLRDAHTFYSLPDPYQNAFAFLPFQMRCYYEKPGGARRYIITKLLADFEHELFTVNAEITSWNGVPTEQAVEREGFFDVGANPSARLARAMNRMCDRPLAFSVPPKESFVIVGYKPAKGAPDEFGIVMPWHICTNGLSTNLARGNASSLNESMAQINGARNVLFHRSALAAEISKQAPLSPPDENQVSKYPTVFAFQHSGGGNLNGIDPANLRDHAHPDKKFGYIQIRTFELNDADATKAADQFVVEFERIVKLMQTFAPDGLIVDVRSNPGGSIEAAERILQFLTPDRIQPANFHFISSETTQHIAATLRHHKQAVGGQHLEWDPWIDDLLKSSISGDTITSGQPLTKPDDCNTTSHVYQGPVTLIIDSLAYSATDIFAAGFQDHKIGEIIGVDENTGGGGANRWMHSELWDNLKLHGIHHLPMQELPAGANMGLAIRRCSRVAENEGRHIEDEGVHADLLHYVTHKDLLNNDCDLLALACKRLGKRLSYRLKIDATEVKPDGVEMTVTCSNLFRLECVLNGEFNQGAVAARDGQQFFKVSTDGLIDTVQSIQINGYVQVENEVGVVTKVKLVAMAKQLLDQPAITPASAMAAG